MCIEKRKGVTCAGTAPSAPWPTAQYSGGLTTVAALNGKPRRLRAWRPWKGRRDLEVARAVFVAAAIAAEMLMVKEEYIQPRSERRPRKSKHRPETALGT